MREDKKNFDKVRIDKNTLNHNDNVFVIDICEYDEESQIAYPFFATVKITDNGELFFDVEGEDLLYSDSQFYVVVKVI